VTSTAPPLRRSNAERSAATRARLIDATVACLIELGWSGTSTTEVVRRAGVSRGAQVHHFPTKEDLVLAAIAHVLERRTQEFETTFAELPPEQRSPATAMLLLYQQCYERSFSAWLELLLAARTDAALHARIVELEARSFDRRLEVFQRMFSDAAVDDEFARVALRLSFALLNGLAIDRLTDVDDAEIHTVLQAFNAITAPFFPHAPGGTS
jgi:AcrR family transcriptional regulator